MKPYNPVDVCHYCNDRMYEYMKQKIHEKIEFFDGLGKAGDLQSCTVIVDVLESLLENEK